MCLVTLIGMLTVGCTPISSVDTVAVTATYRERIALRPGAVLEASVVDVSRADAPAEAIGSTRIVDPGSPPFRFDIAVDADRVDPSRSYAVRVVIRTGGELVFTTDTGYPVLTRGAGRDADVLLRAATRASRSAIGDLPATFIGALPCADCPGIDYHVDLFPDAAYYLRMSYRERERSLDSIGSWAVSGTTLALWSDSDRPIQLRIVDDDTLRLLARDGSEIESSLNYALTRSESFVPTELTGAFSGMYEETAAAAIFAECQSGRRLRVGAGGGADALAGAYRDARRGDGDALLATIDGTITVRAPADGGGMQPTVVVERFTGIWPAETCGARMSTSELLDTNWVLTRLGGRAVSPSENSRAPNLVLRSDGMRATGFAGCNDFQGGFELRGESIVFARIATTLRACIGDGDDTEARYLGVLGAVTRLHRTRHHLELFDASGEMLARFEAREL